MKTGTMVEYANQRTHVHVVNFNHLYDQLQSNDIDDPWLSEIERRHNIFPDIDYRIYA
jgi:1,4-alpha-glucan branching enzyme